MIFVCSKLGVLLSSAREKDTPFYVESPPFVGAYLGGIRVQVIAELMNILSETEQVNLPGTTSGSL